MAEAQDDVLKAGYLSEDSKRKFTLVAGVLGALFFVLQFVVPMIGMFALMPMMMSSHRFATYDLESSALYRGEVYLVEAARGFPDSDGKTSATRLLKVGPADLEEIASLDGWEPKLLATRELLWLVGSSRMASFDGRRIARLEVPESLGDISRPFRLGNAPAVVESRPDGERLQRWEDGHWVPVRALPDVGGACCVQLVETDKGVLALRERGQSLFARNVDQDGSDWIVVASAGQHWFAFEKDGKPAVASSGSEGFRAVQLDGQRWTPVATSPATGGFPSPLAVFQVREGGPLTVVSSSFPGSLKIRTWDEDRFTDDRRIGNASPFPTGFMAMMWIPHGGSALLGLVLAVILSSLMRVHRVSRYVFGGTEVAHASLTRRALSQLLDAILLAGPGVVMMMRAFGDFEDMVSGRFGPLTMFAFMGAAFAWALLALVAFSASEGYWGVTPGKWLAGIRVIGTDLKPCGFGRGLIRNLLKFVDGFFNFLVGMLMVAYTTDWQRLGDLAARTIVIRVPPGGLAVLRAAR